MDLLDIADYINKEFSEKVDEYDLFTWERYADFDIDNCHAYMKELEADDCQWETSDTLEQVFKEVIIPDCIICKSKMVRSYVGIIDSYACTNCTYHKHFYDNEDWFSCQDISLFYKSIIDIHNYYDKNYCEVHINATKYIFPFILKPTDNYFELKTKLETYMSLL